MGHKFPCSYKCKNKYRKEFSLQVVGDDLLMSTPKRIEKAIGEAACNALVLKVPTAS